MTTITYCGLASEYYMAYPLDGLFVEAPAYGCRIRVSNSPPSLLRKTSLPPKDAERLFALAIFQVASASSSKWFCLDAHDDSGSEGYFQPILEKVDHYFKLNLNPSVFAAVPALGSFRSKIHSLPCTFVVRPGKPWRLFPRLRPCRLYGWNWFSVKRRLRALQRIPSLEWHRSLRSMSAEYDAFLVRRYYHQPEHAPSNELYRRVFDRLKQTGQFSGALGFTGTSEHTPEAFRKHALGQDRSYRDHLTLMARSRVCIYLPGTYNCLSFKFGQYLALGKPIVGMRLPFWPFPEMDQTDKELLEEQFCCAEPEEIPARLAAVLGDAKRLNFLQATNIRMFERYFSPRSVARHILDRVL